MTRLFGGSAGAEVDRWGAAVIGGSNVLCGFPFGVVVVLADEVVAEEDPGPSQRGLVER